MIDTGALLDLAKSRQSIPSDYKLGVTLGLSDSAITNYRKGRSKPDDAVATKLASLAGLDAGYVLACLHAERAQNDEARSIWQGIAARLSGATAAVMAVILSGLISASPDASAMAFSEGKSTQRAPTLGEFTSYTSSRF